MRASPPHWRCASHASSTTWEASSITTVRWLGLVSLAPSLPSITFKHQPHSHRGHALLLVLFLYDFVVTLVDEVTYFWGSKPTGATVVFFLNRYTALLYTIFYLVMGFAPCTEDSVRCVFCICIDRAASYDSNISLQ